MSGRLPDPREKPWLTVAELAAITGEGEKAIRAALDAGHLPMLRVGRYVRIPTAALLAQLGITTTDAQPDDQDTAASIHALRKVVSE
jgi:excisionase family DNA binding protein